jgi:peptidyl-dipeptidase Dcp
MNALMRDWDTPFGMPPFAAIRDEDFAPAFDAAFAEARKAVAAIAGDPEAPSFANTIEAMERASRGLGRVAAVFYNLAGAHTNDRLEALQREVSPKIAAFRSEVAMNAALFARVEALWEGRAELGLTDEQARVLELYRRMFVRAGARLEGADRARLAAIMERLAALGTAFSQNVLADERDWVMPLATEDLEGLPDWLVAAAAEAARERGQAGHVVTLSRSLIVPFLQLSPRRDLRERAFSAWVARGAMGGATDNRALIAETLALRAERASLLGYPDFATFKLETEMAKTPEAVRDLLMAVWAPARAAAEADAAALAELMREDGVNDALRPWDWRYYAAIRQKREHALDEAEVKPYLRARRDDRGGLRRRRAALRALLRAGRGAALPPDARAWEVRRGERHMGVFVGDYLRAPLEAVGGLVLLVPQPAPPRRRGAADRDQRVQLRQGAAGREDAAHLRRRAHALPRVRPRAAQPDVGRDLRVRRGDQRGAATSSSCRASSTSTGSACRRCCDRHARHVATGAALPPDLLERVLAARTYDTGFQTVEYLASALVDLDLHEGPPPADPAAAEAATLARIGLPEAIVMRHASPHFLHVFSGDGYSAGYYSYMWSEVMDADAFAAFEETGDPFDAGVAARLAEHVFAAGGTREADALYTAFRGRMPGVEALLEKRGLKAA